MKKQTKIIKGLEVTLKQNKSIGCKNCVFYNTQELCWSDDMTCLFVGNNDMIWKLSRPWKNKWYKLKNFFQKPEVRYILIFILSLLILLFVMAGESIIEYLLLPLKNNYDGN